MMTASVRSMASSMESSTAAMGQLLRQGREEDGERAGSIQCQPENGLPPLAIRPKFPAGCPRC